MFLVDQALKGNTLKTVKFYKDNLRYFTDFVGSDIQVVEITIGDLNKYLLSLKNKLNMQGHPFQPKSDKAVSITTIQTYIRAVRGFLGWFYKEGHITDNLQEKFKLPKAVKKDYRNTFTR